MKLHLSLFRMTYTFLIAAVLGAALIFGSLWWLFLDSGPWIWKQWVVIVVFVASTIFFYVLSVLQNYYILEKKYVLVHRFKKEMYYYFSEIIYIDERYSKKHKMILFVTNHGDVRYLTFDRQGLLYQAMLEKCSNLIELETLKFRYPNIKL